MDRSHHRADARNSFASWRRRAHGHPNAADREASSKGIVGATDLVGSSKDVNRRPELSQNQDGRSVRAGNRIRIRISTFIDARRSSFWLEAVSGSSLRETATLRPALK
jgi:hypothetical protein